jgi:hypothetical protein
MTTMKTVLTKNPDAAFRIYDGQATIVTPSDARVDVLNEAGSRIWDSIDGRRTLGQILEVVLQEYDIDPARAEADLIEFVAALQQSGMVR